MSASISESPGQDRDDQVVSPGLKAEFRDAVRSWSGHLATALRDLKVVGLAAGDNLALFMAVVLGGAVVLLLSNAYPQASFPDLLVDSFHMAFLRRVAANGDGWVPVLLTFLLPLFTVLVLGEGALRAISIYLRRRTHQEEWDLMVARTFAGHTVICGAGELGRAIYHR